MMSPLGPSKHCTTPTTPPQEMQRRAGVTIILFTLLYLICNVPVVVVILMYALVFIRGIPYTHVFSSVFLYWYSWVVIYIIGVALNSTLNPLLYLWRMHHFRDFILNRNEHGTRENWVSRFTAQSSLRGPGMVADRAQLGKVLSRSESALTESDQ